MLHKNIRLVYFLSFLTNCWFWLGVWIFYYLRFTNYAGVGLIETACIITVTLLAIPSGAIADLLGKKPTLIISFLFQAVGNILMGLAPNFLALVGSVVIISIGGVLFSGTMEALVFDSLKEQKSENKYNKIISNISSLQLIAPAIAGVIGGFLYSINPSYPSFATGFFSSIGFIIAFFLVEPTIDTVTFSFINFFRQTRRGWLELTKNSQIIKQTILLISIGVIMVIVREVLDSILGVEFGFSEIQMGILLSIIFLVSAGASQLTSVIGRIYSAKKIVFISGLLIATTLIISPVISMMLGGVILLIRQSIQTVYNNFSSILINTHTQSKYRATTLSTFNMLKNIPYIFTAYLIGTIADVYSAKNTAVFLGLLLMIFLGIQYLFTKRAEENNNPLRHFQSQK